MIDYRKHQIEATRVGRQWRVRYHASWGWATLPGLYRTKKLAVEMARARIDMNLEPSPTLEGAQVAAAKRLSLLRRFEREQAEKRKANTNDAIGGSTDVN